MLFRPVIFRLLPRYRRLMREGAKAKAVVLEEHSWGWVSGVVRPNHKLKLRVHFDDGTTTTIERVERTHNLGAKSDVGSTLPMRYEPNDRSYIEIDCGELRRLAAAQEAKWDRARIREAERQLTRQRTPPPPAAALRPTEPEADTAAEEQDARWLQHIVRLKVDRDAFRLDTTAYEQGRAQIADDIRAGRAPVSTGPDADRLALVANLILGEPLGATDLSRFQASSLGTANLRLFATLLEQTCRLKIQRESGEIDDGEYERQAAALGGQISAAEESSGWA